MRSTHCSSARPSPLTVLCVQVLCLAGWPLCSEAARLRCGSDLLSDLLFVCGDRGIYLGKGSWSGYGARPRGKGIVDQCCRTGGCDLQLLEKYCAKPKSKETTTAGPATTTTAATTTQQHVARQLEAVFHKKLLEHLGGPGSAKRESYRKRPSQRRQKDSSPKRRSKAARASGRLRAP